MMSKFQIKKFSDIKFTNKKEVKESTPDESNTMDSMKKTLNKLVKAKDSEFEIVGINDVSFDKPLDVENAYNIDEATIINADLGNKEAKRGDLLYITAMVKKKNVSWTSMAVLKVRIVDIYQGLSVLNTLK